MVQSGPVHSTPTITTIIIKKKKCATIDSDQHSVDSETSNLWSSWHALASFGDVVIFFSRRHVIGIPLVLPWPRLWFDRVIIRFHCRRCLIRHCRLTFDYVVGCSDFWSGTNRIAAKTAWKNWNWQLEYVKKY